MDRRDRVQKMLQCNKSHFGDLNADDKYQHFDLLKAEPSMGLEPTICCLRNNEKLLQ